MTIVDARAEHDQGPRTLPDVLRDLRSGVEAGRSYTAAYMFPDMMTPYIDRARDVEHQVRGKEPQKEETAFLDNFWSDHDKVIQTELNRQLGLKEQEAPVHRRKVNSRVGEIDVEYRICPGLATVPDKDGSPYQWYFRRIKFPEQSPVLSVPTLSSYTFRHTDPDQLVLRPTFPAQPQPASTAS